MRISGNSYQASVARVQAVVNRELALQQAPGPDGLLLQPHSESLFLHPEQAKGTVLMYHGYTAGPWQYEELAHKFCDAGYNVIAPRMPGHGCTTPDGVPTGSQLPNNSNKKAWETFIDESFEQAEALGAPVYAVGLSGGANVALRLAEKHPEVKGVAAMAPYLGGNLPKGLIFPVADALDIASFGAFGHLIDHVPFHENEAVPNDPSPHTQGSLGSAKVMRRVGANVRHVSCPVQMLTTAGDMLSGSFRDARMFERCGGEEQSGWFQFPREEGVPHAMVSPVENPVPEAVAKVQEIVFNFIDKGQLIQQH